MKNSRADSKSGGMPLAGGDESTGLPWLRTWSGVYFFVFVCFVLSVLLLLVLTKVYS